MDIFMLIFHQTGIFYAILHIYFFDLTFLLLNTAFPVLANSVDPDQLTSEQI